jgi:hypothetical protein
MTVLSRNARVAGLVYIVASLVGVVRLLYVPAKLIVHGDAAATANNIAAHELLFRIGIVSSVLGAALWLFVPLAFYRFLKDVDQPLAVLMVILGGLMQVPLFFVNTATDAGALLFARGDFLSVFDKAQRDALVMLFLKLHHNLDLANAILWGLWLFPLGLLFYRSSLLPRFLCVWLMTGCFAWMTFSVTGFLSPCSDDKVFTYMQQFAFVEVATMFWL